MIYEAKTRWRLCGVARWLAIVVAAVSMSACAQWSFPEAIVTTSLKNPESLILNGFQVFEFAGIKALRTLNFKQGTQGGSFDFQPLAKFSFEKTTITLLGVRNNSNSTINDISESNAEFKDDFRLGLKKYDELRGRMGLSVDPLPEVAIIVAPQAAALKVQSFQIHLDTEPFKMMLIVPERASTESSRIWTAKVLSLLAHELVHLRALNQQDLYANDISNEAVAYLTQYCVRWILEAGDLPSSLFPVDENYRFESELWRKSYPEIVHAFEEYPATIIGQILAQASIWKEVGQRSIPFDSPERNLLIDACISRNKAPPNFLAR